MAKFQVGDLVRDICGEQAHGEVLEVRGDRIRVLWENGTEGAAFWSAAEFDLITPATKEPEMKYSEILEPREPVKAYKPKVGFYALPNCSQLQISRAYGTKRIDLRFGVGGAGWSMRKPDIAELIKVLQALHDAMDD